jgi:DNA mismatch endonuclease (patch repair protein)
MDNLTKEQRSRCMAKVKSKNTLPEKKVRSLIRMLGYQYHQNPGRLPGKPDIVLNKSKKVIFVHGCFWHMHNCKKGKSTPRSHYAFWQHKRLSNKIRDKKNIKEIKKLGWKVLVLWECQIKKPEFLKKRLKSFLDK